MQWKISFSMNRVCSIMQPTYLPWLGYFDLIDRADVFVFYDDVQVVKRSWGVRNKVKTANGPVFLSVPIDKDKHRNERTFFNAQLDYSQNWVEKHLETFRLNYKKASFFEEIFSLLENELIKKPKFLAELNISLIKAIIKFLELNTELRISSEMNNLSGKKENRLIQICERIDADKYLSPQGSSQYIEAEKPGGEFSETEIDLYYQNFVHPTYPQLWGDFVSHLPIVDVLMNCGKEETLRLMRSGQYPNYHYTTFRREVMGISE